MFLRNFDIKSHDLHGGEIVGGEGDGRLEELETGRVRREGFWDGEREASHCCGKRVAAQACWRTSE